MSDAQVVTGCTLVGQIEELRRCRRWRRRDGVLGVVALAARWCSLPGIVDVHRGKPIDIVPGGPKGIGRLGICPSEHWTAEVTRAEAVGVGTLVPAGRSD